MAQETETTKSFILFTLAGATYGVSSKSVKQMEMIDQITPVPNAPPFVEGVAFSRGQVVPAINLRVRFGFERVPHDLRSRLIVVAVGDRLVGLLVDSAREFISIENESLKAPSETVVGLTGQYIESIANLSDRVIFILNVAEILRISEVNV